MKKNVGIFIFDDAEVLDFAGPFEVFSVTSQINNNALFNVFTVSKENKTIAAVNGLLVTANFTFADHPAIDILVISGGQGTKKILKDIAVLSWLEVIHKKASLVLSVCSGARLLATLGLLDNKPFCTHHQVYEHIKEIAPSSIPVTTKRFMQTDDKTYTSGGISAGIDLSFHIVEKLLGKEIAANTARYMEYSYHSFE